MSKKKKSITLLLRNYFITGVVVLIPIGFTLYLSKVLIGLSSRILPENINENDISHDSKFSPDSIKVEQVVEKIFSILKL